MPNVYGHKCGQMRRPKEPVVTRGMLLAQPPVGRSKTLCKLNEGGFSAV